MMRNPSLFVVLSSTSNPNIFHNEMGSAVDMIMYITDGVIERLDKEIEEQK